ncbi:MAG: hypothetical protein R3301_16830, partial [Saprospiraceae bacterium]|nr:hypothetical protein [Saprospiraceae bacterium]
MAHNRFCLFLLLMGLSVLGHAATCTWLGGSGNWNNTANWDCGLVPGPGDTAIINTGTITLDLTTSVSVLHFNDGSVTGANTLTITDSLSWLDGSLASGLELVIGMTAGAHLGSPAQKSMSTGVRLINHGVIYHQGGNLSISSNDTLRISATGTYFYAGGNLIGGASEVIVNDGLFEVSFDATLSTSVLQFINNGTFRKTGGNGTLNINCIFTQNGIFEVPSCEQVIFDDLILANGSVNEFDTAVVFFDDNTTLDSFATITGGDRYRFVGGTVNINAVLPPNKYLSLETGAVYFNRDYASTDTFDQIGSIVRGAGTLTVNGVYLWKDDPIETRVLVSSGGQMRLLTGNGKNLSSGGRLDIAGELYHESGTLSFSSNDTIHIAPGASYFYQGGFIIGGSNEVIVNDGLFEMTFDGALSNGLMQFINNGTFRKTGGSGTLDLNCQLQQNGVFETPSCELVIFDNVVLSDGSVNEFDTAVVLFDDPATLDSFAVITGGERYRFDGTSVTINAVLPPNKYLSLESGTVTFNRNYASTDTFDQIASAIDGIGTLTVDGQYLWKDNAIRAQVDIGPAGQMHLLSSNGKTLSSSGRLNVYGSLHHANGTLSLSNNDTLHIMPGGSYSFNGGQIVGGLQEVILNDGLFDIAFDATISSGNMQFINNGTLQKSAGTGTLNLDCILTQNGTLTTQHCEMVILDNVLLAAGSITDFDTAIVLFDDPATLDSFATITGGDRYRFDGTTITIDAMIPQDRYLSLETGTVLFNRDFTFTDTVDQISSFVAGSGSVTVAGVYLWKDDPISTTVIVSPTGQIWLMTNQGKSLSSGGKLRIAGVAHHLAGTLSFFSNDTIHIEAGGVYHFNGGQIVGGLQEVILNDGLFDVAFDATISSGDMQFINNGILEKSAGSGTLNLDCTVTQNGTLTTQHCEMVILDNVLLAAGSTTDFDTAIVLFDDPATLDSLATITGGDRYRFDGTTVTIDAVIPQDKYLSLETGTVLFNRDFTFTDTLDQIGSTVGGNGSVTVAGVYLWKDDPITTTINVSPTGEIWLMTSQTKSISSGGKLSIAGEAYHLAGSLSFISNDTVHVEPGGSYFLKGGSINGGTNEVILNDGLFQVESDVLMSSSTMQFLNHGTFSNAHDGVTDVNLLFANNGIVNGRGTVDFFNLVNNGAMHPGLSVDTLTLLPAFDNTNSTLEIEIESTDGPGTGNDLLSVDGPVTLAGTLDV